VPCVFLQGLATLISRPLGSVVIEDIREISEQIKSFWRLFSPFQFTFAVMQLLLLACLKKIPVPTGAGI
jgi:hypothetical protein